MMTLGKPEHCPSSKCDLRRTDLKQLSMVLVLSLAMMLFSAAFSAIAVQGFSTLPTNARGCGSDNRGITSIRSGRMTTLMAGLFGEKTKAKNQNSTYSLSTSDWQIYVDQSKASLDRGGGAVFDAFFSLCDFDDDGQGALEIQVIPAILPKPASGGKGPWIRCIWNNNNRKNLARPSPNLDVSNVDSVDKVYRVLTKHLGMKNISIEACQCLKWKYKGNLYLESGEIKPAIDAYNQALAICEESSEAAFDSHDDHSQSHNSIIMKQQEGLVLLLRASAFLQQARFHKEALQKAIGGDEMKLPTPELLKCVLSEAISPSSPPSSVDASLSKESVEEDTDQNGDTKSKSDGTDGEELSADLPSEEGNTTLVTSTEENDEASSQCVSSPAADTGESKDRKNDPQTAVRLSVLRMLKTNGNLRQVQLEKIKYRHGLYQTSLLQATRDSLRATEALPSYPTAWLRAGELLSDLWKIKESKQYYERALSIDGSLEESIGPLLEGLERRQELVELARTKKEWPEDSLQLALDITE